MTCLAGIVPKGALIDFAAYASFSFPVFAGGGKNAHEMQVR
jgi:hypothetical protein